MTLNELNFFFELQTIKNRYSIEHTVVGKIEVYSMIILLET